MDCSMAGMITSHRCCHSCCEERCSTLSILMLTGIKNPRLIAITCLNPEPVVSMYKLEQWPNAQMATDSHALLLSAIHDVRHQMLVTVLHLTIYVVLNWQPSSTAAEHVHCICQWCRGSNSKLCILIRHKNELKFEAMTHASWSRK